MSGMFNVGALFTAKWLSDALIGISLAIDSLIYSLISVVYRVFIVVAETNLFDTNEAIGMLTHRIYVIFGVAMLFLLAYNIIVLIINPDKMSDNSDKSLKGIIKNAFISILLIALLPTIFNYMKVIQDDVLQSNVIGNIILGSTSWSTSTDEGKETLRKAGTNISLSIFSTFFHPQYVDTTDGEENGELVDMTVSDCILDYDAKTIKPEPAICNAYVKAYSRALNKNNITYFTSDKELIQGASSYKEGFILHAKKEYTEIKYMYLVSTACAILAGYLFVSFTFDIAVRTVKLAVLQIIAPLPIIARITKPSGGLFDKWFKEIKDTYLLLFIRLAIIYFVIFMISYVISNFNWQTGGGGFFESPLVFLFARLFIICGMLVFAKQAPKLIETMIGSLGGASWSIRKKLSSDDYSYARRASVAAGNIGRNLGRSVGEVLGSRGEDGKFHWRNWKDDASRTQGLANLRKNLMNTPGNIIHGARYGWKHGDFDMSQGFKQGWKNYKEGVNQATEDLISHNRQVQLNRENGIGLNIGGHRFNIPGFSRLTGWGNKTFLTGYKRNPIERMMGTYDMFDTAEEVTSKRNIQQNIEQVSKDDALVRKVADKVKNVDKSIASIEGKIADEVAGVRGAYKDEVLADIENRRTARVSSINGKYDNDLASVEKEIAASRSAGLERLKAKYEGKISDEELNQKIKDYNNSMDASFENMKQARIMEIESKRREEISAITSQFDKEASDFENAYSGGAGYEEAHATIEKAINDRKDAIRAKHQEKLKELKKEKENIIVGQMFENLTEFGDKQYFSNELKMVTPDIMSELSHLSVEDIDKSYAQSIKDIIKKEGITHFKEDDLKIPEGASSKEAIQIMKGFYDKLADGLNATGLDELKAAAEAPGASEDEKRAYTDRKKQIEESLKMMRQLGIAAEKVTRTATAKDHGVFKNKQREESQGK